MDKIKIIDELSQNAQKHVDIWIAETPNISITSVSSTAFVDRHESNRLTITILYIDLDQKKEEAKLLGS